MCDKLLKEGVKRVAIESTGIYWIPVWNILEDKNNPEELACCNHGRIINSKGEKDRKPFEGFITEHHRLNLGLTWEQYILYQKQLFSIEKK